VSALQDVELSNLCQSINLGGMYLQLTAGTGKDKVTADAMITHSDDLDTRRTTTPRDGAATDRLYAADLGKYAPVWCLTHAPAV